SVFYFFSADLNSSVQPLNKCLENHSLSLAARILIARVVPLLYRKVVMVFAIANGPVLSTM
ncbi:MAG: hypothetical protein AB2704_18625, partial [Candidatus Thiodiazotropha taylori]